MNCKYFPIRACVILVAFAPSLAPLPSRADDVNQNISISGAAAVRSVLGPATIRWFGINPLRYPSWSVSINGVISAGPSISLFTSGAAGLPAIDSALSKPLGPAPGATAPAVFLAPYIPDEPAAKDVIPGCSLGVDGIPVDKSWDPWITTVNTCYAATRREYSSLLQHLYELETHLAKSIDLSNTLITKADCVLADPKYRVRVRAGDCDVRERPGTAFPELSSIGFDEQLSNLDANIQTYVIGRNASEPGTARYAVSYANSIPDWPSDRVAALVLSIKLLSQTLAAHTFPTPSPKPVAAKPSPTKPIDKPSGSTRKPSAGVTKPNFLPTPIPSSASAAPADCVTSLPDVNTILEKACLQDLGTKLSALAAFMSGSDTAKGYTTAVIALRTFVSQRLLTLSPSRFRYIGDEECRGIHTSRRDMTFTLALDIQTAITLDVVCRSKLLLSTGLGFSTLGQRSFTTVPINPAGHATSPATPNPQPSGAGLIQATGVSEIRAIPVTLLNYSLLTAGNREQEIFASFGIGVGASQTSTFIDYVGGISFAASRAALLTLGAHLGAQTVLDPGYHTGEFTLGVPPTTSHYTFGLVLIASYGIQ